MKFFKHVLLILLLIAGSNHLFARGLIDFKDPRLIHDVKNVYLTVKPDLRKCVSPICGGWIVKAVNKRKLRCPDGTTRSECYVGSDKIRIPGLSDMQIYELRQAMSISQALILGNISNRVDYGLLLISAAWLSATSQVPSGVFVSVSDNGIRCITYPCPSYDAHVLNRHAIKSLAGFDLIRVDADKEQLARAQQEVQTDDGLHMAGRFVEITGPAGSAQGIEASQFYLKLVGDKPKMCAPTGCSGQLCSDTPINSTCEWKPEYACYQNAICTSKVTGACGWVMDAALKRCLANAKFGGILQLRR